VELALTGGGIATLILYKGAARRIGPLLRHGARYAVWAARARALGGRASWAVEELCVLPLTSVGEDSDSPSADAQARTSAARVISYTGVITRTVSWRVLEVDDDVRLFLIHCPLDHLPEGALLRAGARVVVRRCHVLFNSGQFLGLGACGASHIEVVRLADHAEFESPALRRPPRPVIR
jgi:hypothetical protein